MKRLFFFILIIACSGNGSSNNTGSGSGSGSGSGGGNGNTTPPNIYEGVSENPAQTEPFKTFNILVHGKGSIPSKPQATVWTSDTDSRYSSDQIIFVSDQEVSFRLVPQISPGKTTDTGRPDTYGVNCLYNAMNYGRLAVTVGIRPRNGTYLQQEHTFGGSNGIAIDTISEVFTVDMRTIPNSVSEPFVVEVSNISWDWDCKNNWGGPSNCPTSSVWAKDCVRFYLQMATDLTKQFP